MLLSPLIPIIVLPILASLFGKVSVEGCRAQGLTRLIRKLLLNRIGT